MIYVTNDDITALLGADWGISGNADMAVMLANSWLNNKHLPFYDNEVPNEIKAAGAQIAKEVVAGNMYQGRSDGVISEKTVKAGSVSSSKKYVEGADGQAISSGEQMANILIASFITGSPVIMPLGRF